MKKFSPLFAIFGVMAVFLTQIAGQPEQGQAIQAGVEVQTRGPIHEAFAEPVAQRQVAGFIVAKQPPELIKEMPPEQKPAGDYVLWIPGYWAWDEDRSDYLWVSGVWRAPPPNHRWIPGYWQQSQEGWRWITGYWAEGEATTSVLYPAPPDPVEEAIPPAPNAETTYVPGNWVYVEDEYRWRPGQWIGNQPGWIYTPASYWWTPRGYNYVNGFWDHDLMHRGLSFAPVYIDPRIQREPGWYYRPNYAIGAEALLGSLFVQPARGHYYFGDYYDAAYARRGYTPWMDHRFAKNVPDPLLSYYRWENRNNARWTDDLHGLYNARRDGQAARPARTLELHQQDIIKNKDKAIQVVTPLNQWPEKSIKLDAVSKAHAEEIHKNTDQWQTMKQQRSQIEAPAQIKPPVVEKVVVEKKVVEKQVPTIRPQTIELPKTVIAPPAVVRTPPPHPQPPVVVQVKEKEKGKK